MQAEGRVVRKVVGSSSLGSFTG